MWKFFIVCVFLSSTAFAEERTLADAVKDVVATQEWRQIPRDWLCYQPGVVQVVVSLLNWQRERIAQLEAQVRELEKVKK